MYQNKLKAKIREGTPVVGCIIQMAAPPLVEMCGLLGFDFVFIDAEHGPLSPGECEELVRAADARGITPLVRVWENRRGVILRYMDTGAHGVIVPAINSAREAREAVQAARYFPEGRRGLAGTRASDYGLLLPIGEYTRQANRENLVVGLIESGEAVDNIEEIVATEGLDGIFIGTTDLSHSLGVPGQFHHPAVEAAFQKILRAGRRSKKFMGAVVRSGEEPRVYLELGIQVLLTSVNGLFAAAARDFLAQARTMVGGK